MTKWTGGLFAEDPTGIDAVRSLEPGTSRGTADLSFADPADIANKTCNARVCPHYRLRVLAAFFPASDSSFGPLVRTALRAAAERSAGLRFFAALFACFESAARETVERGSFLSASSLARDRVWDTGSCFCPFS